MITPLSIYLLNTIFSIPEEEVIEEQKHPTMELHLSNESGGGVGFEWPLDVNKPELVCGEKEYLFTSPGYKVHIKMTVSYDPNNIEWNTCTGTDG